MDAFYAAVEERDDPGLREVPMAVGGTGMITTANYMVRGAGEGPMPRSCVRQCECCQGTQGMA
jgi:DNA polymerase kappa